MFPSSQLRHGKAQTRSNLISVLELLIAIRLLDEVSLYSIENFVEVGIWASVFGLIILEIVIDRFLDRIVLDKLILWRVPREIVGVIIVVG